ncbi:MFS-type transporter SLC18B1-like isoform X2 [Ostrea edulis]|uniref:MFS-type transporter SLC18B1-like isoform X2 n=1 Tax=Ostrea edulis TaxID=37623 RepID=UPI0024AF3ED9|nr:MFS-type transporter SLC18B1-like isoform X2 [Ostrea edulis]
MEDSEREPLVKQGPSNTAGSSNDSESNSINRKEDEELSFSKLSKQNILLLVSMASVNFFSVTCFSLLAPFFPAEAGKKGVSQTTVGMIFGVFEFVIFLSSPILGNYITKIGSKFMFLSGTMIGGICAILFGVLDRSPDGTTYIVMCFLCRTVEAIGCSMFVTASFAIIACVFPNNVATMFGVLETFSGLGLIAGPAVGGALYQLGGFGLPFFVVGSITVLNGVAGYFMIGHIDDSPRTRSKSILSLLRSPFTWSIALCLISGSFSLGFLDPTLALHVDKLPELKGKTALIGLMFLIAGGMYCFTAPLYGYIVDKKGCVKIMMAVGGVVAAIGYLLMGPTPLIPHLPLAFLGPTVGGVLVDKFGFNWSATGASGFIATSVIVVTLYGLCRTLNEGKTQKRRGYEVIIHQSAVTSNV